MPQENGISFLSLQPLPPRGPRGPTWTCGSRSFWNILWALPDPGTQQSRCLVSVSPPGLRTAGPGRFLSSQPLGEGSGRGLGWASVLQGPWPPRSGRWPESGLALLGWLRGRGPSATDVQVGNSRMAHTRGTRPAFLRRVFRGGGCLAYVG